MTVRRGRAGRGTTALAVLGVVAALGACSQDAAGAGDAAVPVGEELDLSTPLEPYLAEIERDTPRGQPNPWAVRFEEAVAACMAEEGFEYHVDELAGVGGVTRPREFGTVAFAEQYGYGESIPLEGATVPMLWNYVPTSEGRAWNAEYRDALSPEARAAYDIALDGAYAEASPDDPPEGEYDPSVHGCHGRASMQVYPDGYIGPEGLADVKQAVLSIYERVEEDPRVVEALGRWSVCMADSGHPGLESLLDAESLVATEIFTAWQEEWADRTGTALGVTDYDVVRRQVPDGLAELRRAEIDLAVTDAQCRLDSGYLTTRHEVQVEIEQEILDTYHADLEAWVTWLRENEPAP